MSEYSREEIERTKAVVREYMLAADGLVSDAFYKLGEDIDSGVLQDVPRPIMDAHREGRAAQRT